MKRQKHLAIAAAAMLAALLAACGREIPENTNLLVNASFEEDVVGNVPSEWRILNFRGLQDMKPVRYGVTDSVAYDGQRSFFFEADGETERFFVLSQEVKIEGAPRLRLRGAIKTEAIGEAAQHYPQANFALTYYDKDRARFTSARFADVTTPPNMGTSDGWVMVDRVFRVPDGAATVALSCALGMSGRIWFDDLSLEVPTELPWLEHRDDAFIHYYLAGHDYPEGSIEFQYRLYAGYAARLGIAKEDWLPIEYYYYPDAETMKEAIGVDKPVHVDYFAREIHSINPADNHEIVHLLTHPYGIPPRMIAEGTAFYLMGEFNGEKIQPAAQRLLLSNRMPPLKQVFNPVMGDRLPPELLIPTAASFVGYLLEYGGPERFLELHREVSQEMGYDALAAAFEKVYGGSLAEAETVWREILRTADFSSATAPAPGDTTGNGEATQ